MLYKFQVPVSNKRSNGQVRDITLPIIYGIQSKVILTWILNNLLNFRILSQAILYILCCQGFSIVIKAKSKKGHNSINVLQNSLKSYSGHLKIDPKLYAKYQKPSSSSSQDTLLKDFSIVIIAKS